MTIEELLPLIIPLAILQIAIMLFAIYDLTRPERRVRGDNKLLWGLVIVLGQILGSLIYFLVGREET
ncbi:MAG TPA: PLDc N-terminal domain-containing protein [Candidatus Limnocylindria bacterium]|nr:PLDc N-terminal domain-containing protein [Candidatus Limnocylindria bacterium]